MSPPISCQLHDYIEIACLYRLQVRVDLTDGSHCSGMAVDTRTDRTKQEYLVLQSATNGSSQSIELTRIRRLTALTDNPHFDRIEF